MIAIDQVLYFLAGVGLYTLGKEVCRLCVWRLASRGLSLRCAIGIHKWDGHTDPEYPAPRCERCGTWHHRDIFNRNK